MPYHRLSSYEGIERKEDDVNTYWDKYIDEKNKKNRSWYAWSIAEILEDYHNWLMEQPEFKKLSKDSE